MLGIGRSLYRRAGELGYPPAIQALSMAYLQGELGLERDPAEANHLAHEAEEALTHGPPPP